MPQTPASIPTVVHNDSKIMGGLELWLSKLLARLVARGHPLLLLCRNAEMERQFVDCGVPARVFHIGGQLSIHDAVRLAVRLRRWRCSTLVLSSFKKAWIGALAGRLAGVTRVVGMIRWSPYRTGGSVFHRLAFGRLVHLVVTNAETMRRQILEDLPGADPRRVITIYNGASAPPLSLPAGELRNTLGIPSDAPVVGTLARLVPEKRIDVLLRSVQLCDPPPHCVVAGEGPERGTLERLAGELALTDRVRFLGLREDIGDILSCLDLMVVTSQAEGMSNAMLEALASGVPVVSTSVSGAVEALAPIEDGRAPGLVVSSTPSEIGAAVGRLMRDPDLRTEMADAARIRARALFGWDDKVVRWEALLAGDSPEAIHEGPSRLVPDPVPS